MRLLTGHSVLISQVIKNIQFFFNCFFQQLFRNQQQQQQPQQSGTSQPLHVLQQQQQQYLQQHAAAAQQQQLAFNTAPYVINAQEPYILAAGESCFRGGVCFSW